MEKLARTTKTNRVSYCDPDATDSSSYETSGNSQRKSKRKVHVIEVELSEDNHNPRSDSGDFQEETRLNEPSLTSEAKKMVGVKMTTSGKFWAEIKDPIKKIWVWLGFFGTAEEASRAFLAEEYKFAAAKLRANQRVERAASENSVPINDHTNPTSAGKRIEGVRMSKSGKFGISITDPLKKKKIWLGSFTSGEEASRAYFSKKAQIEAKQLRAKRRIERVAAAKSTLQDSVPSLKDTSDLTSFARTSISGVGTKKPGKFSAKIRNPITKRHVYIGNFDTKPEATSAYLAKEAEFEDELRAKEDLAKVASEKSWAAHSVSSLLEIETSDLSSENKVSGEQEAGFGFFNGVQVIDRNGFLVGEFSMLDDLRICSEMEDSNS